MTRSSARILASTLAAAALALAARADIKRSHAETHDLAGIESVEIHVASGSLELVGEARSGLRLDLEQVFHARTESEADEIAESVTRSVKRRGSRLVIEIAYEPSFWKGLFGGDYGVDLNAVVTLPETLRAEVRCDGGDLRVRQLRAGLDARANGGRIEISDARGPLEARANGGTIRVQGFAGKAELQSNGGRIEIRCAEPAEIEATANGGGIDATFEKGLSGDTELVARGGNVVARLPGDARFDLEASSRGGEVRLAREHRFDGKTSSSAASGKVNGGGPELELSSAGGKAEVASL